MKGKAKKVATIIFCMAISFVSLCGLFFIYMEISQKKSYYEKYDNEPYIVNGFDYGDYLGKNARFVHYQMDNASALNIMGPEMIVYKKTDKTYFAIVYFHKTPNEVTIYENLKKDDITKDRITKCKCDFGYDHYNYDVSSNDDYVWILNEEKGKTITY